MKKLVLSAALALVLIGCNPVKPRDTGPAWKGVGTVRITNQYGSPIVESTVRDDSLKVDTWFSIVSWTDEAGLTHKLNLDLNTVVIERGVPKA